MSYNAHLALLKIKTYLTAANLFPGHLPHLLDAVGHRLDSLIVQKALLYVLKNFILKLQPLLYLAIKILLRAGQ